MKKKVLAIAAIAVIAVVTVGCTHHTCPAYRGSTVMVENGTMAEQA
ncbi:MAG: hypothetical protein IJ745_02860 [Bacteroidales bacterium]|nr:hypothetical protein [Bacteroidales bacterium]